MIDRFGQTQQEAGPRHRRRHRPQRLSGTPPWGRHLLPALAAAWAALAWAGGAWAATVSLATPALAPKQSARLTVSGAAGPVGGSSDLAPKSVSARTTKGSATVELGPVPGPGTYFTHLSLGPGATYDGLLLALPAENGNGLELTLLDATAKAKASDEQGKALAAKFYAGLTADRMKQAATHVAGPWLAKNAVAVTTTVIVCAVPGEQLACAFAVGGHLVDLSFDVLTEVVAIEERDGLLTAAEARKVRVVLGLTGGAVAVALPGQTRLDRALTAVQMTEMLVEEPGGKLLIRYGTDEGKKLNMLMQFRPKK